MASIHLTITGRVQGVGYRAWLARTAARHSVAGWVRNRRDGSVEAVLCGDEEILAELVARCHEGSSSARVSRVETEDYPEELKGDFRTLPTA